MVNMDDGAASHPPGGKQAGDVAFGPGVVACSPSREIKRLLDVNDDEGRVGGNVDHGTTLRLGGDIWTGYEPVFIRLTTLSRFQQAFPHQDAPNGLAR